MAEALLGWHALTGCNSTNAFHGKRKSKAFALALKDPAYLNVLKALGEDITVSTSVERMLETFVSELYGVENSSDINDARYEKFCTKVTMPEPSIASYTGCFPPASAESTLHGTNMEVSITM